MRQIQIILIVSMNSFKLLVLLLLSTYSGVLSNESQNGANDEFAMELIENDDNMEPVRISSWTALRNSESDLRVIVNVSQVCFML